jgi:hypothetical protein
MTTGKLNAKRTGCWMQRRRTMTTVMDWRKRMQRYWHWYWRCWNATTTAMS